VPHTASVTRQRLRAVFDEDAELYDRGEVVVSAFEDWPLPSEPFDALCAFTSWHWLDPGVRTAKAVIALRKPIGSGSPWRRHR
jgi:hypothetical protein